MAINSLLSRGLSSLRVENCDRFSRSLSHCMFESARLEVSSRLIASLQRQICVLAKRSQGSCLGESRSTHTKVGENMQRQRNGKSPRNTSCNISFEHNNQ